MKIINKILAMGVLASTIGSFATTPIFAETETMQTSNEGRLLIFKKFYINALDTRANNYEFKIKFKKVPDGIYPVGITTLRSKFEGIDTEIEVKDGEAILPFAKAISRLDTLETGRYRDISFNIGNLPLEYEYELEEVENEDFIASYFDNENDIRPNYTHSYGVVKDGKGEAYVFNTDKRASLSFTKKADKDTSDEYDFSLWVLNTDAFMPSLDVDLSHLSKLKTWDDIINFYTTSYQEKYPDKTFSANLDNWMPVFFSYAFDYFCSKSDIDNYLEISGFSQKMGEVSVNSTLEDNLINMKADEGLINLMPKIHNIYNYSSKLIAEFEGSNRKDISEYEGDNYKEDVTEVLNYLKEKITAEEFIKLQLATIANIYDYRASTYQYPFFYQWHISQAASNDMKFGENGIVSYSHFNLKNNEEKTVYIVSNKISYLYNDSTQGHEDVDVYEEECLLDEPYSAHYLLFEKSGTNYISDSSYIYDGFEFDEIRNSEGESFIYQLPKNVIITNSYKEDEVIEEETIEQTEIQTMESIENVPEKEELSSETIDEPEKEEIVEVSDETIEHQLAEIESENIETQPTINEENNINVKPQSITGEQIIQEEVQSTEVAASTPDTGDKSNIFLPLSILSLIGILAGIGGIKYRKKED